MDNQEFTNDEMKTEDSTQEIISEEEKAEDVSSSESEEEDIEHKRKVNQRSYIVWLLAGGYLVYTAYQLCKSVIEKTEGTGPIFMVAGIAFGAVGLFLCYLSLRGLNKQNKEKRAEEEAAEAKAAEERKNNPNTDLSNASMSIADKANLVSRLGADNEEENEEQNTEETKEE